MFISHAFLLFFVSLSPAADQQALGQQTIPVPVQTTMPTQAAAAMKPTLVLEQPAFGHRGQKVIHGATSANAYGQHLEQSGQKGDSFSFLVAPTAGVFVTDHLYLGGGVNAGLSYNGGIYFTSIAAGPVLGFYTAFSPNWGFFPTIAAAYQFRQTHAKDSTIGDTQGHQVYLSLHADAVVHLTHHVSMTMGPSVNQSVYNHVAGFKGQSITTYGINVGFLVWLS